MKLRNALLLTTTPIAVLGFETKTGWKTGADGSIETDGDGNPIFVGDDGKEQTVGAGYIKRLTTENSQYRKDAKEANEKLKAFGDLDPVAAKAAVDKLKDVDFDALVNKGEVESVKSQLREQFEAQLNEANEKLAEANRKVENLALNNAFNSSEFLKDRLAVPADAARATFRDRFKVEGDKVIPLDGNGNPLLNKHGDTASVDEAFETFINARADKDTWLRAPDASGSGSQGGGGGRGQGNIVKRADFDAMAPGDQAAIGARAAKGEVRIVD